MKAGDWLTGIKYPVCDYAQILAVEESVNQIRYTLHCYRKSDNYETDAEIGFDKKKNIWLEKQNHLFGGASWGKSSSKPRMISDVYKSKPECDLFHNEEPDRD